MGKALLLTPGFRFHPTDVELVLFYLKRKVLGKKFRVQAVVELDIYKHPPWDLPDKSCLRSGDLKWYFFCPREKKYTSGARMNRATEWGYWKTTGKDRPVTYRGGVVGMIKTLVFHRGRAPKGDRTDWVMHEYRLEEKDLGNRDLVQDSYVLCMVFQKDGPGPRNGAQYGAPFKEEEWTDDEEERNCMEVGSSSREPVPNGLVLDRDNAAGSSQIPPGKCIGVSLESCVSGAVLSSTPVIKPVLGNEVGHNNSVASVPCALTGFGSPPQSCISDAVPPRNELQLPLSDNDVTVAKLPDPAEDDILSLLDYFVEEGSLTINENGKNKDTNNVNQDSAVLGSAVAEGIDIFEDLGDLENVASLNAHEATLTLEEIFSSSSYDGNSFLELMDLSEPLVRPTGAAEDHDVQLNRLSASFINRCPNSGDPNCQVNNAFNAAQTSLWPGRAYGSEQYRFHSFPTAQNSYVLNYPHSLAPEVNYRFEEHAIIHGSKNHVNGS